MSALMDISERLKRLRSLQQRLEEQLAALKAQEAELAKLQERESMFLSKRKTNKGPLAVTDAEVPTGSEMGK